MYFIGIDIGTTNTKICLYRDQDFKCVDKKVFSTPKKINKNFIEFDVNILWENIKGNLKKIISQNNCIYNICISSVGESGVLVDKAGNVIGPAITWYDTRTEPQVEEIISKIGREKIYNITGLPAHSNYSINKILWIFQNCDIKNKDELKWLSMASFIAYKLSLQMRIDYSLASRTMVFDIKNKKWSKEILNKLNIDENIMPDLVESGEPIGTLTGEFKEYRNITVSIGGHDHMCGAIATGLFDDSGILNSTGTTEGILMLRNSPGLEDKYLNSCLSNGVYTIEKYNTLYASLPCAGLSFEWMKKLLFSEEESFDDIFSKLENVDCKDTIYVPHLRGSGPPNRYTWTRGIIYGLKDTSTKYDISRAILEGVCFELKMLYLSMMQNLSIRPEAIKVIGSAVRNPVWLQLKADILNLKVEAYNVEEAVSKGAALLGAYKSSKIRLCDIEEMVCKDVIYFNPSPEKAALYNEKFNALFKKVYDTSIEIKNYNRG